MRGLHNLLSFKLFQQQSFSEDPLADTPRYEKTRALGRGSFGTFLPAGFRECYRTLVEENF